MASRCTFSRRATRRRGGPACCCCTAFPSSPISWRKVMLPLAAAGFHVVAPDQRGYGRTTGWDGSYDGDLNSFRILNLIRDVLGLLSALGYRSVAARDRARLRLAGGGVVLARAARCVPLGGADERAVRGPAADPLRHRRAGRTRPPPPRPASTTSWRGSIRRASTITGTTRRAPPTTTCARHRRAACLPARLLPLQERRLEGEQAVSAQGLGRERAWQAADLLRHGARQGDGRERCRPSCRRQPRSRRASG